ncbi:MAG: SRPBCC family protein [Planctomycetota bacterium]|nr:SRPBCC family protein [Planctomycetota bacterium]
MAVIGAFLPADHEASRTRRILAPREAVKAAIRDLARHHEWRDDVKRVELFSDVGDRSGYREFGSHGAVLYAIDVEEAPAKFVTRIADDTLPYGGSWTIELKAVEGGTEVTITERGFVKNVIFRFL